MTPFQVMRMRRGGLDITEDFSTDATGKFTNLSTGTAAWNSGTTSLRVGTGASANPIIRWDNGWPLFAVGQSLEMDYKIISEGAGGVGLRHAGIFLTTGSVYTGYRFVSVSGNLAFSRFSGGSETAIATYTGAASTVIVGSDNTIKIVRVAANTFDLYLNGSLVAAGVAGGAAHTNLQACMFGYINTVDYGRMRQWG